MSRLVRSIEAVAGIAFMLAMTAGCGARKSGPPPGLNDVQLAGWQVYVDLDRATCHGENREGKRSGPTLSDLADKWTAAQLVSYLTDPDEMVRKNPRLAYKAEKYAIGMPKVSGKSPGYADKVPDEQLEVLAEYLLFDIQAPGS
jgi:hypothetical protein